MSRTGNSSIYVGDLADEVTQEDLRQIFSQAGEVHSVKRCRDSSTKRPLSYGYVNYVHPEGAELAIRTLNHVSIRGKSVRVMPSQRDGATRTSGVGNVFVKNLHPELVTNKLLHSHFQQFGVVTSAKVARDEQGESKKYGFVQYENPACAEQAIRELNGTLLCGQKIEVAHFIPAKDRASEPGKYCNVYVKSLGSDVDVDILRSAFSRFGPISSTVVMRNEQGFSRGFGFVNFENSEDAAKAVEEMDGYSRFDGQQWKVHRAQKREEAVAKATQQQSHLRKNLLVKNLRTGCTEEELRLLFQPYGTVESTRLAPGTEGMGYVYFQSSEDSEAAIVGLNGQMVGDHQKPLQVTLAPRQSRHPELRQPAQAPRPTTRTDDRLFRSGPGERSNPSPYMQTVPSILTPAFSYYTQGTYFYGAPAYPVQPGQRQISPGYMPMGPQVFDQMGLLSLQNAPAYQGQAFHSGGVPTVPGMLRMDSQSGPYVPFESPVNVSHRQWTEQDIQSRGRRQRTRSSSIRPILPPVNPGILPERLPQQLQTTQFPSTIGQSDLTSSIPVAQVGLSDMPLPLGSELSPGDHSSIHVTLPETSPVLSAEGHTGRKPDTTFSDICKGRISGFAYVCGEISHIFSVLLALFPHLVHTLSCSN